MLNPGLANELPPSLGSELEAMPFSSKGGASVSITTARPRPFRERRRARTLDESRHEALDSVNQLLVSYEKTIGRLAEAEEKYRAIFEDAPVGIQAAKAAGMYAVGLTTTHPAPALHAAGADEVVENLVGYDVRRLLERLKSRAEA